MKTTMTNANFDWIIVGAGAMESLLQKCSQGWGLRSLVEKNENSQEFPCIS